MMAWRRDDGVATLSDDAETQHAWHAQVHTIPPGQGLEPKERILSQFNAIAATRERIHC